VRDTGAASATVPARICLAGKSLDWMIGGPSVVAAIGLRTEVTATVNHRSGLVHLTANEPINDRRTVPSQRLDQLAGDKLDYLQACATQVITDGAGAELTSQTAVPVGAGVSSSAAVTVAASAALLTAAEGEMPELQRLADLAHSAETLVGSGAGWMDFLACAYGGLRRIEASNPPVTRLLAPTLGIPVLLIGTRQRRTTAQVLVTKRQRLADGEPRMIAYRDQALILVEEITTALSQGAVDYAHIGTLISQAHDLLTRYMGCSTPLIDQCVTGFWMTPILGVWSAPCSPNKWRTTGSCAISPD
jgi:mevalonate kinase